MMDMMDRINGRRFFLSLALGTLLMLTLVYVPPAAGQNFADIPWRYVSEDGVWIRPLDTQGITATLTLHKRDSELVYGITFPCPTPRHMATYTWKQGDSVGRLDLKCDDMAAAFEIKDIEDAFEPLPKEALEHPPAEIFINPEQWPPPIIV